MSLSEEKHVVGVDTTPRQPVVYLSHGALGPLFVSLGAADAGGSLVIHSVVEGFWYGLSKRSWQCG